MCVVCGINSAGVFMEFHCFVLEYVLDCGLLRCHHCVGVFVPLLVDLLHFVCIS